MNRFYTGSTMLKFFVMVMALVGMGCGSSNNSYSYRDDIRDTSACNIWEFESNSSCNELFNDPDKVYAVGSVDNMGSIQSVFAQLTMVSQNELAQKVAVFQDKLVEVVETVIYRDSEGNTVTNTSTKVEFEVDLPAVQTEYQQCYDAQQKCYKIVSVPKEAILNDVNYTLKEQGIFGKVSESAEYKDLIANL